MDGVLGHVLFSAVQEHASAEQQEGDHGDTEINAFHAFVAICGAGDLSLAQDAFALLRPEAAKFRSQDALRQACLGGHLPVVQWLMGLTGPATQDPNEFVAGAGAGDAHLFEPHRASPPIAAAAYGGSLEVVQYLLDLPRDPPVDPYCLGFAWPGIALTYAGVGGNADTVRVLQAAIPAGPALHPLVGMSAPWHTAVTRGSLRVVKAMAEAGVQESDLEEALEWVLPLSRPHILRWILFESPLLETWALSQASLHVPVHSPAGRECLILLLAAAEPFAERWWGTVGLPSPPICRGTGAQAVELKEQFLRLGGVELPKAVTLAGDSPLDAAVVLRVLAECNRDAPLSPAARAVATGLHMRLKGTLHYSVLVAGQSVAFVPRMAQETQWAHRATLINFRSAVRGGQ